MSDPSGEPSGDWVNQPLTIFPPALILIRTAEALHNLDEEHKNTRDPGLTPEGIAQCQRLREHLQTILSGHIVNRIVVSPMRRCMETALHALDWLHDEGVPIEANALWQEMYKKPCYTGRPVEELQADKTFDRIDFSYLDPVWPDKSTRTYFHSRRCILERGQRAIHDLTGRGDGIVIAVSHNGFMRTGLTGRWTANGDYRVYSLVHSFRLNRLSWLPFSGYGVIEHDGMEAGAMGRSSTMQININALAADATFLPSDETFAPVDGSFAPVDESFTLVDEN
ncbi:phosphoglycerate mutase [Triangularia verruculosa]|uniref:Phosphoglycerate mutase n=1 Tax=Triangularia verruculosa TaxID=2587418 RepID=A0AAN6XQC6_9PEZI|nr:phosphoglycerate mutase [Triangularia verruculosa]